MGRLESSHTGVRLLLPFPVAGAAEDYALTLLGGLRDVGFEARAIAAAGATEGESPLAPYLARQSANRLTSISHVMDLIRKDRPDLLHVNQVFLPGIAAGVLSRVPVVVTAHNPALVVRYSLRGRALRRWVAGRAVRWIVLSERNRVLLQSRLGVAPERIRVVPPGLPAERFPRPDPLSAREALNLPEGAFVVGTVGRLAPQKRQDILIRAVAQAAGQIPELKLVIIGDGELRASLAELAERMLPGRVIFTGHRQDVVRLLPAFDVFCLTSDFEGLPFAVLEAMAMQRAIVARDVQGVGEALRDGESGLLIRGDSPLEVARGLVRMCREDGLRDRLGQEARTRFLNQFTAPRMVGETSAVYQEFLQSKHNRGRWGFRQD